MYRSGLFPHHQQAFTLGARVERLSTSAVRSQHMLPKSVSLQHPDNQEEGPVALQLPRLVFEPETDLHRKQYGSGHTVS
ncbi:hypothetical protein AGIG_G19455 [Arapaima gigas]